MRDGPDRHSFLRFVALGATAVAIGLSVHDLWTARHWSTPAAYSVDALEVLARFKIGGEMGPAYLVDKTVPGLGAPWTADWSAYPVPDAPAFVIFGLLSRGLGLIQASNLALLAAHAAAVVGFYFSCRILQHRPLFAASAALLFGFCFYNCFRGLSHFSFALTFVVPAQLVTAWIVGSGRRVLADRTTRGFGFGTAVATGLGNPYFGFGFVLLLGGAFFHQLVTGRRRENFRFGLVCLAIFAVTFVALNYQALAAHFGPQSGLLQRNFAGTEIYGLRPIELFLPSPQHHFSAAAALARRYASATSLPGELFCPYLGLAGFAGLAVIAAQAWKRSRLRRERLRPAHAATLVFLTLFFMVGGINSLLALAGFDLFRAGNRYSIYLLAVALLALSSWASQRGRNLPFILAQTLAVLAVGVGLWDEIPRAAAPGDAAALRQRAASDRKLAVDLEAALPAGAAVFQLPVTPFLEQPPIGRMTDYELFRPWFFSHGLNFSYGLLAGHPALRWERWVERQPVPALAHALEEAGYAALYLHRAAFADRGAALEQALVAAGRKRIAESEDQVVYALSPVSTPTKPDLAAPRLAEPWDRTMRPVELLATSGWESLEHDEHDAWRWAGRTATLGVWCPGNRPTEMALEFTAAVQQTADLVATLDGHALWAERVDREHAAPVRIAWSLSPGFHAIVFTYSGTPFAPSESDRRLLGFRLLDLRLAPTPIQ